CSARVHCDLHSFPTRRSSDLWLIGMYSGPSSCCGYFQPSFTMANTFKTDPNTGLPLFDTYNNTDIVNDMGIESSQSFQPYQGTLDRKSTRLNSSHVKISYAVF